MFHIFSWPEVISLKYIPPHQRPLAATGQQTFIFRYKILINKQATGPQRP